MSNNIDGNISSKIRIHDLQSFEVKLDFELDKSEKKSYSIETYFFIPNSLNVGPYNYTKNDFYSASQRYIRFSTPKINIGRLCDKNLEYSPLTRLKKYLADILAGKHSEEITKKTCYEIKLLGCIVRAEVRNYVNLIMDWVISSFDNKGEKRIPFFLENGLERFFSELDQLFKELADLRAALIDPAIPIKVREAASLCDEYISLIVEEYLTKLVSFLRSRPDLPDHFKEIEKRAVDISVMQSRYRRDRKYLSVFVPKSGNETIIYRRGMLKKFISSALYIHSNFSEWEIVTQVVYGGAAAIAMLFATVISVYFQNRYTTTSIPFITAVVITYIFKDRIKDWIKFLFSNHIGKWISDRKIDIVDKLYDMEIGEFREVFTFVKKGDIPDNVIKLRNIDNVSSLDDEGKPERVCKYQKDITLFGDKILNNHKRCQGINDITRINIAKFITQADDPEEMFSYVDSQTGEVCNEKCYRVYHLNMVMRYSISNGKGKAEESFERVRLVLNQKGIVRLEHVQSL